MKPARQTWLAWLFVLVILGSCATPTSMPADGASAADAQADARNDAALPDAAAAPDAAPCEMTVHVLTFNLDHDFPTQRDLEARTQAVADFINARTPDLVALQEASQTPTVENRAKVIAERTGYSWTWAKDSGLDWLFEAGPAVLTRWQMRESQVVRLPRPIVTGVVERAIIGARVVTPCGEASFFGTHIGEIDAIDPTFTPDLALAAYNFILSYQTESVNLLGAGINEEPDSLTSRMLRGETSYRGVTGTLTDAWLASNPTLPGFTYPSNNPRHRIDYIYFVDGARARTSVLGCENVLGEPVQGIMLSDHVGVLCHFHVAVAR